MAGAVLQLVAYGAEDIYLTGNPQIRFFRVVYRRYSNFAIEAMRIYDNPNIRMGDIIIQTIPIQGDLLSSIYLELEMNDTSIINTYYGFQLIDNVDILIGGKLIDRQYGEWMTIWCDLALPVDKRQMIDDMVSKTDDVLYIPLQFWFCRNPGLALPLQAILYHEIVLQIRLKKKSALLYPAEIQQCRIYADYVFLDTDDRRYFANTELEYLIEQVQTTESGVISATETKYNLDFYFKHPVKELIWMIYDVTNENVYNILNYERAKSAVIQMNGADRFSVRKGSYFTKVQRYQYHSGCGSFTALLYPHIYSFSLNPEEHQPSGTFNFSRIDNARIAFELDTSTQASGTLYRLIRLYGVNYNILRIINGMGGLAYT
jgi:hypothetical protein